MATTEDIESRLAAYIDGELDAVGRADIERHLVSNPQHRVLIDELTRQRDLLRALPRQRAPMEVAENINAQLERSALLGDGESEERILRISHWPQIKAAAAVLLLVFSLAAVVYYVISAPKANNEIVMNQPGPLSDVPGRTEEGGGDFPTVLTGSGLPDVDRRVASPQESRTQGALAGVVPGERGPVAIPLPDRSSMHETAGAENARQVLVAVNAPDPLAAQRSVKSFLDNKSLEFTEESVDSMPEPLKLQASNAALASRLQRTQVKLKQTPAQLAERKDGVSQVGVGGDSTQSVYRVRNLTRSQINEMCTTISNDQRQSAAVIEEQSQSQPIAPALLDLGLFGPTTAPAVVKKPTVALDMSFGTTQPADERVDAVIVFNGEAELDFPPAIQPEPPTPTTEPSTAPSSR